MTLLVRSEKSTVSLPIPPSIVSLPAPPRRVSLPLEPRSVSLPSSPAKKSSSSPPSKVSFPAPPSRVSSPLEPNILLLSVLPIMVSPDALILPMIFSIFVKVSVVSSPSWETLTPFVIERSIFTSFVAFV